MKDNNYYFDPFAAQNQQKNQSQNPTDASQQQVNQQSTQQGYVQNQNTYNPYNQPNYGYGYVSAPVLGTNDMADINRAKQQKKEIKHLGMLCGSGVLLFNVLSFVLSLIIIGTNSSSAYNTNFFFQSGFYIFSSVFCVGLAFYLVSRKTRKTVETFLPAKHIPFVEMVMYVIIGLALCRIANSISAVFVSIVSAFGFELTQSEMMYSSTIPQLLFELVAVAVVPGIVEEYAMRGTVLQPLKKHGSVFAIFATACVFGFMHGNLIQAPFALMVGVVLAVITIRTGSIVPAIIIHFGNNANSVINGYLINNSGETVSTTYFFITFLIIMILATICFIYMVVKKVKKDGSVGTLLCGDEVKAPRGRFELTEWQKFRAFLSSPAMIVAIILMLINTAQTVSYTGINGV